MKKLETPSTVLLKHHLKALRLPTMTAECEKAAARCAKENEAAEDRYQAKPLIGNPGRNDPYLFDRSAGVDCLSSTRERTQIQSNPIQIPNKKRVTAINTVTFGVSAGGPNGCQRRRRACHPRGS